jgi:DNA repair photolyase
MQLPGLLLPAEDERPPAESVAAESPSLLNSPRLFTATGIRVTPQVEWVEITVKSVINRVQGMPFKWSINPYRGCAHACVYCFARVTHWYLDQNGVSDWSSRIFVKVNAPEIIRKELARPAWRHEGVSIGTATDPYQPAEGAYRVTRRILEALRDFNTPVSIVTKSTMVIRDRDVLIDLARGPGAFVYFSMTTVDPALAREIEPDVPPPRRRLEAMKRLADSGVPVGVFLAPVLPGITDDEDHLGAVVRAAKHYGARSLGTNLLHLGDVVRDAYFQYLEHKRPDLIPEYEKLYRGRYAPHAYQQRVQEVVAALKRRAQFSERPRANPGRSDSAGPVPVRLNNGRPDSPEPKQQRLF